MNVPARMCAETTHPHAQIDTSTTSPVRAWDLLRTMKAQRESLVERWKEGGASHPSETKSSITELRRNLDQERRRVARRVSIDGSDRTPSTAASTDVSTALSVPAPEETSHLHKSIRVPTAANESPFIVRVTSQSSAEESSGKVSSDESLPTTNRRNDDDHLQVPTLQEAFSKRTNRPPVRKKNSIPRHIVSTNASHHAPMSPLSVSPVSVCAAIDSPSQPIAEEEEVESMHPFPKDSLEELSAEPVRMDVPKSPLNATEEDLSLSPLEATKGPQTPPPRPSTGQRRSVTKDATLPAPTNGAAIVNMSFLDRVVAEMAKASAPQIERPPSPLSSATSWSDASSSTLGDITSSSETSGWVSSTGGESTLLGDGMSWKTDRSSLASAKRKQPRVLRPVSFTPPVAKAPRRRPLFVTARAADALCRASGGHWFLARQSGWDDRAVPLATWKPRVSGGGPTPQIRLSTDFRCGTYGSLYDIARRSSGWERPVSAGSRRASGTVEPPRRTSKASSHHTTSVPFLAARGGIYDTAVHSGFSNQRSSFSVTTCTHPKKETMVPEHISDGHCGVVSVFSALSVIPE